MEYSAAALKPYLKDRRWVGQNNRYVKSTVQRLSDDVRSGQTLSGLQQKHLRELIAASVITHCLDGWALLGRAASSTLLGDPHSARHLAYYAELRGAVSLLASAGISVFNNQHLVVASTGQIAISRNTWFVGGRAGTHVAAWLFLQEWATTPDAAATTSSVLLPEGHPLSSWFNGSPAWATWRSNSSGWLKSLGLDVRLMARDQFARHEASYRPTTIRSDRQYATAIENSRFVTDLWRIAEPGGRPFAALDSGLLRLAVERSYRGYAGSQSDLTSPAYSADIARLVGNLGFPTARQNHLVRYLLRTDSPDDHGAFVAAAEHSKAISPAHHFHAMARAILMLRVATGAARRMLDNAGIEADQLAFWWQQLASSRSICVAHEPEDLLDTWADVADAIEELDTFAANEPNATFVELGHGSRPSAIATLGRFELAGLIGLVA